MTLAFQPVIAEQKPTETGEKPKQNTLCMARTAVFCNLTVSDLYIRAYFMFDLIFYKVLIMENVMFV